MVIERSNTQQTCSFAVKSQNWFSACPKTEERTASKQTCVLGCALHVHYQLHEQSKFSSESFMHAKLYFIKKCSLFVFCRYSLQLFICTFKPLQFYSCSRSQNGTQIFFCIHQSGVNSDVNIICPTTARCCPLREQDRARAAAATAHSPHAWPPAPPASKFHSHCETLTIASQVCVDMPAFSSKQQTVLLFLLMVLMRTLVPASASPARLLRPPAWPQPHAPPGSPCTTSCTSPGMRIGAAGKGQCCISTSAKGRLLCGHCRGRHGKISQPHFSCSLGWPPESESWWRISNWLGVTLGTHTIRTSAAACSHAENTGDQCPGALEHPTPSARASMIQ